MPPTDRIGMGLQQSHRHEDEIGLGACTKGRRFAPFVDEANTHRFRRRTRRLSVDRPVPDLVHSHTH